MNRYVFRSLFVLLCAVIARSSFAENAVVGTGTPASCTETSFNAALALVVNDTQGGVLTFNCGPDPDVILLSSVKNLVGFVVIDGGGKMTLDGQNLTRLFNVNPGSQPEDRTEVSIRNISLNRANSGAEPFGGAILANSNTSLNLDNVTISNSLATTSGGAIATFAGVTLTITNSRFLGNLAANGGAIATRALVTISDSRFLNNNASGGEGGAVQSYDQNLTVLRSQFISNGARFGGAIFKTNALFELRESSFTSNASSDDGGALYARSDALMGCFDSILHNNSAGRDGGAVFSQGLYVSERSAYTNNRARAGGAIRSDDGELFLDQSTLDGNSASLEGGALSSLATRATFGTNPRLRHLTTSNNTVSAGSGGDFAITSSNNISASLENVTLMAASASAGGSTLQVNGNARVVVVRSLLWARAGVTCVTAGSSSIVSAGANIGALGCSMNDPTDAISSAFSGFGLGEFANYGGRVNSYLPLQGSAAIDRGGKSCMSEDARGRSAPVDGDGNGSALCDAGAVERQLREPPPALFRNGFESEAQ